jgi:hypothetical protein
MKVLKKVPWTHSFTCAGCKSELEAEAVDVRCGTFGGSYCESGDEGYYVTCPECQTDLLLDGHGEAKPVVRVFIPQNAKDRALHIFRNGR